MKNLIIAIGFITMCGGFYCAGTGAHYQYSLPLLACGAIVSVCGIEMK